ncbi:ATP-binding cassette domain-containing protein [Streptomyces sp. P38-E01]|uniref:ATP-binding cassette domain-containing protein n=1 Tax=Streptomyces tardus TaxID=2780544 RepID=A0A949N7K2_9ACTN|nr:ABC transporter ATP-binding protein [Streptomyces tardus]MBU7597063.1 ATP-binding cassette domain-containing protein [Streptomyces tardus]
MVPTTPTGPAPRSGHRSPLPGALPAPTDGPAPTNAVPTDGPCTADDPRSPGTGAPETAPAHAVRLEGVRVVHGSGARAVTALDDVSIAFARGTFTAIMGPSGSGKSTLLQCAAGLDRPTAGRIVLAGQDIGGLDENARTRLRRERVGFVFQAFNLVESLTAAENVVLPSRFGGRRVDRDRVAEALQAVGLADRAHHRPSQLSGGQQQRVALARALVSRPDVLFADEPTGALDTVTSAEVLRLMRMLVDARGGTTLMVTHDPVAAAGADVVVFLKDGRVVDRLDLGRGPGDGGGAPCRSSGAPPPRALTERVSVIAARTTRLES